MVAAGKNTTKTGVCYAIDQNLAAEFIGTFWAVFGGCGSAAPGAAFPQVEIGLVGVSPGLG
jgi:aquaporin Z